MKVKVVSISLLEGLKIRKITFEREDGKIAEGNIPFGHKNQTWEYLATGMYVKGLLIGQDGFISPNCDVSVIPKGMEDMQASTRKEITIKDPWLSAGEMFTWDLIEKTGFAIAINVYNTGDEFYIKTKYGDFLAKKDDIESFRKDHKMIYNSKGTEIIVIPEALCIKLN